MELETTAGNILKRAIQLEQDKRLTEALVCYQEGLQLLMNLLKSASGEKKNYLRKKTEEFMNRAENLKTLVEVQKEAGKYHEQVSIKEGSIGKGYGIIFGRFMDEDVTSVYIDDPYIRSFHQCQNLVRFCELLVQRCKNLREILLNTTADERAAEQAQNLQDLRESLQSHHLKFTVKFSSTLHDRQIILSTGWIIKIGRGLDYFKKPKNKFSLGFFDLDLRECHETTVDIFHTKNTKQIS